MSSTLPSSVKNSPCLATAIAVPMVSKKSLISSEKATTSSIGSVRTFTMAMLPSAVLANGAPKVEKSSGAIRPSGAWVTPSGIPAITATIIPMSSEPGTLREARATVTTMEMMPTIKVGEAMSPRPTSVPAPAVMMPASHRPIMAMNRPKPTEMAWRRTTGMASMMASRRPQRTSSKMTIPSRKITLMATCQSPPHMVVAMPAIMALMPRPDAQASGRLAKIPMQMVMMPAPRQVAQASAPASMPAPESTAGLTAMM